MKSCHIRRERKFRKVRKMKDVYIYIYVKELTREAWRSRGI